MRFKSQQFQWQAASKTYVAEASELGIAVGQLDPVVNIDGNHFVYSGTDRDASGEDIAGWRFKPTQASLFKNPSLEGASVLIIND